MDDAPLERRDRVSEGVAERYRARPGAAPAVAVALAAYASFTAALLALGVLLTEVQGVAGPVASFDRDVIGWIDRIQSGALTSVFSVFSTLVDTWTVAGVLVGALAVLTAQRRWREVTVVAVAPAVELLTFLTVTFVIARPRPDVAAGAVPITGSYPSGHAAMAIALYGALAVVVSSLDGRRSVRRVAISAAAVIALGVGWSRLYLAVHYLSDVLVGYVLGAAALTAAVVAGRAVAIRSEREATHPTPRWQPPVPYRIGAAAAIVVVGLLAWGTVVEPRLVLAVQREDVAMADLPRSLDGTTVGVIGDLQVGLLLDNVGMARRAVERLVEEEPDVALILGDFVYDPSDPEDDVEQAIDVVRPLPRSGIRTLAVLGNHDHGSGAAPLLRRQLAEIGVEVLVNDAVPVRRGGGAPLWVAGIGSSLAGNAAPDEALAAVPAGAPRVVMMHNPLAFDGIGADEAPLAVAGHTHGGQIRVPFTPEWSYLRLAQNHPVHADGWSDDYGAPGNRLYVNRGIGMSLLPMRINCSPAITLFTLRSADGSTAGR